MQRILVFLCLFILKVSLSHAALTVNFVESGGNVVATSSGSVNTAGLTKVGPAGTSGSYIAGTGVRADFSRFGIGQAGTTELYKGFSTGIIFSNGAQFSTSFNLNGDWVSIESRTDDDLLYLSKDYVANDPISGGATWSGQTFASMGLISGTYVVTLPSDIITINIGSAATTYTIGGTVTGLTAGSDGVTLRNNGDNTTDILKVTNGGFTFLEQIDGSSYSVTVPRQPTGQTCNVTNGRGTVTGADVTNVTVVCVTNPTVGGTVTGLTADSDGVTLRNNGDNTTDILKVTNGSFTFPPQYYRSDYSVTVPAQPTGQTCTVTNGVGTNITADVTNVSVDCAGGPVVPPASVKPIPTLSEWALILLSMLLGVVVFARAGRQQA